VSEFKWHMMAEEMPEKGKKDYLVMGPNGGLYLAPRFEGYGERGDDVWFRDTRGNFHYPDKVLAWAEVPKLEDGDAQESENSKLRELVRDMFDEIELSGFDPLVERNGKRGPYYEEDPSWRVKIRERMRELGI